MAPVTQPKYENDLGKRIFIRLSPIWDVNKIIEDFAPHGIIDYVSPFKSHQTKYSYYANVKYLDKESATRALQDKRLVDKYDAIMNQERRQIPRHLWNTNTLGVHTECGNTITLSEAVNHQAACAYQLQIMRNRDQNDTRNNENVEDENASQEKEEYEEEQESHSDKSEAEEEQIPLEPIDPAFTNLVGELLSFLNTAYTTAKKG